MKSCLLNIKAAAFHRQDKSASGRANKASAARVSENLG